MIRVRVGIVHGALSLFAVALVGRAAWVQLGETELWRSRARGQQVAAAELPAPRGSILDASGAVLVDSRSLVRIDIAPGEVRDLDRLRDELTRIKVPVNSVRRAVDRNRKWVELPGRYLSSDLGDLSRLRGVHLRPVFERVTPANDGLRRLIGHVDGEGRAVGGLESALDSVLRGRVGKQSLVRSPRGGRFSSPQDEDGFKAVPGHSVVLTIHQGLQDIAERALADAVTEMQASGGDIVVLDPHTGEIRALASRRPGSNGSGASAITEPYEPGSTIKPFIAAALIDRGLVELDERIKTYNGRYVIGNRTISDVHRSTELSFAEVIRHSSNIGIVQVVERLSPREQYEALRDMGFGMTTGLPYPSESSGRLSPVKDWTSLSPASLSMGYELSVTPLQLALAYAAIANGGELLEPQLIKEIRAPDGTVTYRGERRSVRRAMTPSTSRTVRDLLRDVVAEGTAAQADLATFQLAGKSGTARRVRADGRGYEAGKYTASFVGLFPAEEPQIVILVKLDNPVGAYYGGRTAAPVTKAVLEAAVSARDAALDRRRLAAVPQRAASLQSVLPDSVRTADTVARVVESERAPFVFDLTAPTGENQKVIASRAVPDVSGLPVRNAVHTLHRAGFRVALARDGSKVRTVPAAGTVHPAGTLVRLVAP